MTLHQPITYTLLQTLRQSTERLSPQARQLVVQFVESQRVEGEAFKDRGGRADLYYTMFGWMLVYALGIPSNSQQRKAFLEGVNKPRLDELHQTVYKLCSLLHKLLSLPKYTPDAVLRLLSSDEALNQFFEAYQRHGGGGGTNARAARLANSTRATADLTDPFLAMQDETGGFRAHSGAPFPDLLSTSVAVFALNMHGIAPRYDVKPFIEAHWQEDGSFVASLLDAYGDVEYEFYGLLALGSINL
ncbi:MAG: hypothetical protein J6Y97_08355 [Prevotella sp.]|nr:hypothetical protein [Prevotella sp.]